MAQNRRAFHRSSDSAGRDLIESGQAPSDLSGLRDIEILAVALDPAYQGDRVGAFVIGMANMIISAHNGKTRYYVSDVLKAEHVYNAARNVEAAAWLLATRKTRQASLCFGQTK